MSAALPREATLPDPGIAAEVCNELPDARERLAYVGQLTERAADKVLSLVESRQPDCRATAERSQELADSLERLAATPELSVERARAMLRLCARFARDAGSFAAAEQEAMTQILMSQDFQDLSGQVIQKVLRLLQHAEDQLAGLAAQAQPDAQRPAAGSELAGPQVPDKALQQTEVDDLLASLGF